MTTSYTTLLGLALPATGDLSGTWGSVVNASVTQLVEDSVAGVATASVLSADWTLTTTGGGASNEARKAILIPTGSSGTTRNINAPKTSKAYLVVNNSTGSVVVRGGPTTPTTGATVLAGASAVVAWNGSDFVNITPASLPLSGGTMTGAITFSAGQTFPGASITAVASGAISNGDVVYLNSDGTVTTVSSGASVLGSATTVNAAGTAETVSVYHAASQKIVIFYVLSSNTYGYAIVGTVSGTSISFGTAANFNSGETYTLSAAYCATSQKIVVAFRDAAGAGKALVGTVSGTGISFGALAQFTSTANITTTAYDSVNDKVVIAYRGSPNSYAIVGTVSGTSISFGTAVQFASGSTSYNCSTYDSFNGRIVLSYQDNASAYFASIVGTVSGTSISFGTEVSFYTGAGGILKTTYDTVNQKVVNVYQSSASKGFAIVGTVSGTSISFGTAVQFDTTNATAIAIAYDSNLQKLAIFYRASTGFLIYGAVSGTSISFNTATEVVSSAPYYISMAYDSVNKLECLTYADSDNSYYTKAKLYKPSKLTNDSVVGIANAAYADGATATLSVIGGTATNQSGLTTAKNYYINESTGLKQTTATTIYLGKALSATKLLVKG